MDVLPIGRDDSVNDSAIRVELWYSYFVRTVLSTICLFGVELWYSYFVRTVLSTVLVFCLLGTLLWLGICWGYDD